MRWPPIGFKLRGVPTPPATPAPLLSDRPSTVLGLLSDLTRDPRQAIVFVFIVGSLLVIITLCFVGACFAIVAAAKGIKGVPMSATVSVGLSGASIVTLVSTIVARKFRKAAKADQTAATTDK